MATSLDPSAHPALSPAESGIVKQVWGFTREFFQNPRFDSSHDFNHVMRVVATSIRILEQEEKAPTVKGTEAASESRLSAFVVILGALLHDVDDRKYIDESRNGVPVAKEELLRLGLSADDAAKIQMLVDGVSYTSECKDPERTKALIQEIPELAVVQDADRLDAIGAVGIARCFTFGGAKRARTLESSVEHFVDKLLKLEGMMKTDTGRRLAAERTKRLRKFMNWWDDETSNQTH